MLCVWLFDLIGRSGIDDILRARCLLVLTVPLSDLPKESLTRSCK